jgi:hypothetical protein
MRRNVISRVLFIAGSIAFCVSSQVIVRSVAISRVVVEREAAEAAVLLEESRFKEWEARWQLMSDLRAKVRAKGIWSVDICLRFAKTANDILGKKFEAEGRWRLVRCNAERARMAKRALLNVRVSAAAK